MHFYADAPFRHSLSHSPPCETTGERTEYPPHCFIWGRVREGFLLECPYRGPKETTMNLMYFTERPYRYVPEDELIKNRAYFGLPNTFFDREKGSQLYNEYLDEMVYAEDVGFDSIMLNEHHGTPFCMGAVMNVEAAILARITHKARIILLGNP